MRLEGEPSTWTWEDAVLSFPEALGKSQQIGRGGGWRAASPNEQRVPAGAGPAMTTWDSGGFCVSLSSWPYW